MTEEVTGGEVNRSEEVGVGTKKRRLRMENWKKRRKGGWMIY